MLIRDVIRDREPYSMKATASVIEAAEFMASRRIGAVCVLDQEGKLIGVFSERDLLNRVVVPRHDPAAMRLGRPRIPPRGGVRCRTDPHPRPPPTLHTRPLPPLRHALSAVTAGTPR